MSDIFLALAIMMRLASPAIKCDLLTAERDYFVNFVCFIQLLYSSKTHFDQLYFQIIYMFFAIIENIDFNSNGLPRNITSHFTACINHQWSTWTTTQKSIKCLLLHICYWNLKMFDGKNLKNSEFNHKMYREENW